MTTANNSFDLSVENYQEHLSNGNYLREALSNELSIDATSALIVRVNINDVSHRLASGYGTWQVIVTMEVNDEKKVYKLTHHNENWYLSQKIVHDPSIADSEEELNEAIETFQRAFEAVIDANVQDIADACQAAAEENNED